MSIGISEILLISRLGLYSSTLASVPWEPIAFGISVALAGESKSCTDGPCANGWQKLALGLVGVQEGQDSARSYRQTSDGEVARQAKKAFHQLQDTVSCKLYWLVDAGSAVCQSPVLPVPAAYALADILSYVGFWALDTLLGCSYKQPTPSSSSLGR